ncbi:MAG: ABC transporter permease [Chloroflexota bacterium]|nr:ABC transporter permease [Chloroflexota bacterium]
MKQRAALLEVARVVIVVALALAISFIVILIVSKQPGEAFKQFITGAAGSRNRVSNWLVQATTMTFTGLAVALVFQARQFSLGAEGQLYLGALMAGVVALHFPGNAVIVAAVAVLVAILTGFLFGLVPGYLKAYFGANEIVSTLMLNAIATAVYAFILVQFLKPPGAGTNNSKVFAIFGPTGRLHPLIAETQISVTALIAIAAAVFVHVLLYRTTFGYGLRMSGFNLRFAEYGGINTRRTVMLAMAISGGIAGIAGAGLVLGTFGRVNAAPSAGYGFDGIVVALLARNFPLAVIPAALFYSYLRVGADVMGQSTDVPFEMANVIQAIIILLISAEALTRWLRRRRGGRDEPELPPMSAPATITSTATVPTEAAG